MTSVGTCKHYYTQFCISISLLLQYMYMHFISGWGEGGGGGLSGDRGNEDLFALVVLSFGDN